jgi:hypothetical protein
MTLSTPFPQSAHFSLTPVGMGRLDRFCYYASG